MISPTGAMVSSHFHFPKMEEFKGRRVDQLDVQVARQTSNLKGVGSSPTWDDICVGDFFFFNFLVDF